MNFEFGIAHDTLQYLDDLLELESLIEKEREEEDDDN